jgi:hypothetical protein
LVEGDAQGSAMDVRYDGIGKQFQQVTALVDLN